VTIFPFRSRRALSALARSLALLPLILLLQGSQFAGAVHDHPDDHASEGCSVCLHAHAPAVEPTVQPTAAPPAIKVDRPHLAPAEISAEHAPRLAATRAPPRA